MTTITSDYIDNTELMHILASLMPANRLAMELSLATGLRISDVLSLPSSCLKNKNRRISVTELKTGKHRRLTIPCELWQRMLTQCGKYYIFEHRLDRKKHRTRQAVYKDLKRSAKLFRISPRCVISPHTARKVFARDYVRNHTIGELQKLYNHDNIEVTLLYAMSDVITNRKLNSL